MTDRLVTISVTPIGSGPEIGFVDDVSIREVSEDKGVTLPEKVVNGGFEDEPWSGSPTVPPGWYGGATPAPSEGSATCARIDNAISDELGQDVVLEEGKTYDLSMKIRNSVRIVLITRFDGETVNNYLTPLGWTSQFMPLFYTTVSEWASFAARFTVPSSKASPDIALPPTDLFVDASAKFIPGGEGATLAIAGLAVAGLSRAGFYPKQTDDIVAPPADPPVFDGGIYAYHKDEEGKE